MEQDRSGESRNFVPCGSMRYFDAVQMKIISSMVCLLCVGVHGDASAWNYVSICPRLWAVFTTSSPRRKHDVDMATGVGDVRSVGFGDVAAGDGQLCSVYGEVIPVKMRRY